MTLQGIGAVLAGFVGMAFVVMIGSAAMSALMGIKPDAADFKPTPGYLPLDFLLGMVAAITGGLLVTRIAPASLLLHALALATLVLAMAVVCMVSYGDKGPPRWYQALLSLSSAASIVAVGWLA